MTIIYTLLFCMIFLNIDNFFNLFILLNEISIEFGCIVFE